MSNTWIFDPKSEAPKVLQEIVLNDFDSQRSKDILALCVYILAIWFLVIAVTSQVVDVVTPYIAKLLYVIAVMSAGLAYAGLIGLRASWRQAGVLTRNLRDDATDWGLLALGFGAWASMHPDAVIVTTSEAFLLVYLVWPVMFCWGGRMGWRRGEYIAPLVLTSVPAVSLAHDAVPFEAWQGVTLAVIIAHGLTLKLRSENGVVQFVRIIPFAFALSMGCEVYLHAGWIPSAAIAAIWGANHLVPRRLRIKTWVRNNDHSVSGAVFVIGVLFFILSFINVNPDWDPIHYGYFLYPSRDAFFGKTPLVDISFQYGYLNVYLMAAISYIFLQNINYWSAAITVNILNIFLFMVIIYIAKRRNEAPLSILVFICFIIWGKYSQQDSPDRFPSVGFLRFGPSFIVLALLSTEVLKNRWIRRIIQVVSVGIASIYSIECLLYVSAIIWACIFCEFLQQSYHKLQLRFVPDLIFPLIAIINIILVFLLLASVLTVVHVGEWPDWRHYTQFLTLYSDGFGFWQPKVSDPWLPVLFISVLGLCWGIDQCLIRNREIYPKKQSSLVMMVGALGIAQFTYFVYRPHPFNLYHIMWPSIIILYWHIDYLVAQQAAINFQKYSILLFVYVSFFVVIIRTNIISLNNVAAHTGLGWVVRQSIGLDEIAMPWGSPPISASTDASGELHRLFDEFPASQSRIPMIVDVDILDAGLLQTRKINWFPISYEEQDGLIPLTKELMSQAGSKVEVGAMLIIERGLPRRRPATYGPAFDAMCSRGSIVEVLRLQRMSLARFELAPPYGLTDLCREELVGAL